MDTAHKLKNYMTITEARRISALRDALEVFYEDIAITSRHGDRFLLVFKDMSALYVATNVGVDQDSTSLMILSDDNMRDLVTNALKYSDDPNFTLDNIIKTIAHSDPNSDEGFELVTTLINAAIHHLATNEDRYIQKGEQE